VVITMWQSADLLKRDRDILRGHAIEYKCYLNMIPGEVTVPSRFFYRLRKRLAGEAQRLLKFGTGWAVSYAPELLIRKALVENADLYAAHLECGFIAGRALVKAGKKVSFDFEDWYSRDYLTPDRAVKLLSDVEAFALREGRFCTAPSATMAAALQKAYPASKAISVIYNSFPDEELTANILHPALRKNDAYRIIWTSRTIGPGRGLETLLKAFELLEQPVELHIIGKCAEGYEIFLQNNWPKSIGHKLIFHDFIPHADLLNKISTFDLGLAIEQYEPDSRNTTITNKILQYLQAGVKVLATDTEGQKEVAGYFNGFVKLVPANNPLEWKKQLESFVHEQNAVSLEAQQKIFREHFSWPVQEQKLKQLFTTTL